MIVTKEIDDNKHYKFPSNIKIIEHDGKFIVIAVDFANWIVLKNKEQVVFFNSLFTYPLNIAIKHANCSEEDIHQVIQQIEARNFERESTLTVTVQKSMHIYLTNSCNMLCPHCYMYAGKKKNNELTFKEVCALLDSFSSYGGEKVVFSGGEVMMRKDLIPILKHAHQLGFEVAVLTNGVRWSSHSIKEASPYINRLQISIDGFSEETNSKVRGKNNFSKALWAVDEFIKHGVFTEIAVTPFFDEHLKGYIPQYINFGKTLLNKYKEHNFAVKFSGDLMDGREIKFSLEQKQEYLQIIEQIFKGCYGDVKDVPFIEFHKKGGLQDNCSFGNIKITADGDAYFCADIFPLKAFANIRKDSFEKIIELSELAKVKSHVNNLIPCRNCELKFICGGDCRIKYFDNFINETIDAMGMAYRKCTPAIKNRYYNLMIRTNNDLFI